MNFDFFTRQLTSNARRIETLVTGVAAQEAVWRPDADSWSVLEVVNHLFDEEREDFRVRLNIILHSPKKPWPEIDPEGWAIERKYNERDIDQSLNNFLDERKTSLKWLHGLERPDWTASSETPFGPMRAGDMFASWVTHDHMHMRQLVEIHRAYTDFIAKAYSLKYAGLW